MGERPSFQQRGVKRVAASPDTQSSGLQVGRRCLSVSCGVGWREKSAPASQGLAIPVAITGKGVRSAVTRAREWSS